jgi:hypothetical protein
LGGFSAAGPIQGDWKIIINEEYDWTRKDRAIVYLGVFLLSEFARIL